MLDQATGRISRPDPLSESVYASPRVVTDLGDCLFYHTMDIPGFGHVEGQWDLREGIGAYLGHVDLRGKRVLEVGTASGFVCFHMEREGADVVAYDLSEDQDWDVVPYTRSDHLAFLAERRNDIRRLNNSFWLCHRAFGSRSKMVYGDVYSVPEAIGPVDICTFGSILLHLRDPFLALQKALRLTRETVIVTDVLELSDLPEREPDPRERIGSTIHDPSRQSAALVHRIGTRIGALRERLRPAWQDERARLLAERHRLLQENDRLLRERAQLKFLPDWRTAEPKETWWHLSPHIVVRFLGILGFERTDVTYHAQKYGGAEGRLFTVVGHRTIGGPR